MTKTRITLVAVLLALLGAQFAPAGAAEDPRAAREAARDRQAQLAEELDGLAASENELLDAIAVLSEQVDAQSGEVDAARQAVAAAEGDVAEAETAMAETGAEIGGLTEAVVERAVETFIRPTGSGLGEMVQSRTIAEASRKRALLDQVTAKDDDVIDQLNAAQEDFELRKVEAEAATAKADERRVETEARLAELEATRSEQARLVADLDTRQSEVSAEIDAQAASEEKLTRIIAEAEARAAASAAASAAARSVGGAPGAAGAASSDRSVGGGGCIWPTAGSVTSEFGSRWGRLHAGIDIAASTGTPIYAAQAGTVIFAGVQSGYGNVVIISHDGGLSTLYGHQSRVAASNGQAVSQGDNIGFVGNTGRSTGPHLHFETRYGGSPRNPRGCLP
ncbi:MAG: peptidoglycan DD-metalloendopeptidase family protein [Actinomycetota bacterium]|nr:peptidoglycan DD-metalloendopeptidase family protein [Actinomycetota bacterium]